MAKKAVASLKTSSKKLVKAIAQCQEYKFNGALKLK